MEKSSNLVHCEESDEYVEGIHKDIDTFHFDNEIVLSP